MTDNEFERTARAWLDDGPVAGVRVAVVEGRIASVQVSGPAPDDERLPGLVLPGFANAHSHAFHRALRGRTHDAGILSAAGIPTAMLFVRNPTGVSHSPAEHAEPADCSAGVAALARAIEALA